MNESLEFYIVSFWFHQCLEDKDTQVPCFPLQSYSSSLHYTSSYHTISYHISKSLDLSLFFLFTCAVTSLNGFFFLPQKLHVCKNTRTACQSVSRVHLQWASVCHWGDEPWDQANIRWEQERYGEAKERYVLHVKNTHLLSAQVMTFLLCGCAVLWIGRPSAEEGRMLLSTVVFVLLLWKFRTPGWVVTLVID